MTAAALAMMSASWACTTIGEMRVPDTAGRGDTIDVTVIPDVPSKAPIQVYWGSTGPLVTSISGQGGTMPVTVPAGARQGRNMILAKQQLDDECTTDAEGVKACTPGQTRKSEAFVTVVVPASPSVPGSGEIPGQPPGGAPPVPDAPGAPVAGPGRPPAAAPVTPDGQVIPNPAAVPGTAGQPQPSGVPLPPGAAPATGGAPAIGGILATTDPSATPGADLGPGQTLGVPLDEELEQLPPDPQALWSAVQPDSVTVSLLDPPSRPDRGLGVGGALLAAGILGLGATAAVAVRPRRRFARR